MNARFRFLIGSPIPVIRNLMCYDDVDILSVNNKSFFGNSDMEHYFLK
jgi:hypothetical protein